MIYFNKVSPANLSKPIEEKKKTKNVKQKRCRKNLENSKGKRQRIFFRKYKIPNQLK